MLVTELVPSGNLYRALSRDEVPGMWFRWSAAGLCITVERSQAALCPVLSTRQGCATVRAPLRIRG